MRLWLIGMMGSGKSTAGRRASEMLGVDFVDTDEMVAKRAGAPIAELWAERGEATFRALEREAIEDAGSTDGIISTGGGAVLDPGNRAAMGGAKVVWLRADPEALADRLQGVTDRPLLARSTSDEETLLTEILAQRTPLYRQMATHTIETEGRETEAIAREIEAIWKT